MAENVIITIPNSETLISYASEFNSISNEIYEQTKKFESDCNFQAYVVNEFNNSIQDKLNELNSIINDLQVDLNSIQAEINKYKTAMQEYEQQAQQIKYEIEENNRQIKELEKRLQETASSDSENGSSNAEQIFKQIEALQNKNSILGEKLADIAQRYNECKSECIKLEQQYIEIFQKQEKYKQKYQQIYSDACDFNEKWNRLCEMINNADVSHNGLECYESISLLSKNMEQFAQNVEAITWGYHHG